MIARSKNDFSTTCEDLVSVCHCVCVYKTPLFLVLIPPHSHSLSRTKIFSFPVGDGVGVFNETHQPPTADILNGCEEGEGDMRG